MASHQNNRMVSRANHNESRIFVGMECDVVCLFQHSNALFVIIL